jgi:hypothetical protein
VVLGVIAPVDSYLDRTERFRTGAPFDKVPLSKPAVWPPFAEAELHQALSKHQISNIKHQISNNQTIKQSNNQTSNTFNYA